MKTISVAEFRRNCSAFLKLVNETHAPIQITRNGRPLAEIKPPRLSAKERAVRGARDLEILNRFADELNADAGDVLEYQAEISLEETKKRKAGQRREAADGKGPRPRRTLKP